MSLMRRLNLITSLFSPFLMEADFNRILMPKIKFIRKYILKILQNKIVKEQSCPNST